MRAVVPATALAAVLPLVPAAPAPAGGDPVPFTEEAAARGVSYLNLLGNTTILFGCGAAFCDLDGDGDPDLVALGSLAGVGLWENDGTGHFTDRLPGSGLTQTVRPSGVSAADYDADGDLDLYVTNGLFANHLWRNEGGFTFVEVGAAAGVDDPGAGQGSAWGDYDGDGWLDLYVANRTGTDNDPHPNRLYRNRGDGTFEDVAATLGVQDGVAPTFQAIFFDLGRDGDADLYLSTDKGGALYWNHLYENLGGGTFLEVTDPLTNAAHFDSMGVDVGDFDGNFLVDLYCANTQEGNGLYVQVAPGLWEDQTAAANAYVFGLAWGVSFLDYDDDGWTDLYVCNEISRPNALLRHEGAWPTFDVATSMGVASTAKSFGGAVADVDGDGDLDLYVANYAYPGELYINHEGERRNRIRFRVEGAHPNLHGIGTVVDVLAGGRWRTDEILAGSGFKSQSELVLHFGLDALRAVDEVRVSWPGGVRRTLRNLPANETWTLHRPERLGDADGNGVVDGADLAVLLACWTGSSGEGFRPGCEIVDLDGDADVDFADLGLLHGRMATGGATSSRAPDAPAGSPAAGSTPGQAVRTP